MGVRGGKEVEGLFDEVGVLCFGKVWGNKGIEMYIGI